MQSIKCSDTDIPANQMRILAEHRVALEIVKSPLTNYE